MQRQEKLAIRGVTKTYGATRALQDVSLSVAPAEVVMIVGPSGCGKTTLLNVLAGFEKADGDCAVQLNGASVESAGPDRSVVFQAPALFPWLTVLDNVTFGHPRKTRRQMRDTALELLDTLGLRAFANHYPYQLSGGMKQRTAIARALLRQPDVLLMDEPFGALDAQTRLSMQELLQQMCERYNPTIVFITHDVDEAIFLGDRVLVMSPAPGRFMDEIVIQAPRPRQVDFLTSPEFTEMKSRILHKLRESRRAVTRNMK